MGSVAKGILRCYTGITDSIKAAAQAAWLGVQSPNSRAHNFLRHRM
jgi:hypothetical protein